MSTTKTKKSRSTKNHEIEITDAPTPAENQQADAGGRPAKSSKTTTRPGMKILSVALPEKLARQVRLLCSVEGTSAQAIVEAALRRAVAKRLPGALAELAKTDGDAEPE
jgi:hypothetical protein